MTINKKTFLIIVCTLIIILFLLIVLTRRINQPVNNQFINATPTVEFSIPNSEPPKAVDPTEIVPGTGAGEDGLPLEKLSPTQKLINKIKIPNPFVVYAAVDSNTSSSNPLFFLRELFRILFSFNPPTGGPISPYPTNPAYPQPTFNPSSYGSPPNKPYYNPSTAYRCYTPQRFIQVYANGVGSQAACWADAKSVVETNLTRINLLGTNVSVHRKVAPFFSSVDNALARYKVNGGQYNFPSRGNYNFSYVGTYAFRCNVNSSTTRDLCSPGCTLSPHAFGFAVDINPSTNANGSNTFDMPPEVVQAFEAYGFRWGGRWGDIFGSTVDAMHFEYLDEICR